MGDFTVELLTAARVMEVYPLVRQLAPGLGLQGWRRYAAALLRERARTRGIILLRRSTQRFPCGLCCFRLDQDLRYGRMLTAEHGLVMATLDAREAFNALVRGIQQIATLRGCGVVRWLLTEAPSELTPLDVVDMPESALVWAPLNDAAALVRGRGSARP